MIGYNIDGMSNYNTEMERMFETFFSSKVKTLSTMYKVFMDFDESKGIHKEVFTVLFIIASLNEKNTYSLSDKKYDHIFNESIIHKLNRALYSQNDTEFRISKPSEIPSWILYGIEKISSGEYFKALAIMAIYFKIDIDDMLISNDELIYFMEKTSIFSSEKMITFERIASAYSSYTPE